MNTDIRVGYRKNRELQGFNGVIRVHDPKTGIFLYSKTIHPCFPTKDAAVKMAELEKQELLSISSL